MNPTREFGTRRAQRPASPPTTSQANTGAMLRLAAAGLAAGAFVVIAWTTLSTTDVSALMTSLRASLPQGHDGPDFSGVRIGRSATAPVLGLCLTKDVMNIHPTINISPDMMLADLKASVHGRVNKSPRSAPQHWVIELAQMWGHVADCVYHQDAYRLCDIDNRTLAIEAGSIFVRQADRIIAEPQTTYGAEPGEIQGLQSTRNRVLELLRPLLQSGVLIASDFPPSFAPPAVQAVLNDTTTLRNDCAKDKTP